MRDHLPVSVRARAATGHRYVPEIAELLDINANGHGRGLAPAGPGTGGSELPSDGRGVTEHDARLLSNHLYAGSPHPSSRAPSAGPEYANQQDLMLVGGRASVASVASFASAGAAASGRHGASSIGRHLQRLCQVLYRHDVAAQAHAAEHDHLRLQCLASQCRA